MVIATHATSNNLVFYFQCSGFPLSCSGTWSGCMCNVDTALQELQTVTLMLQKMVFWLCGNVVALNLDKNIAKAYLHNQCSTASPFQTILPHF